LTLLVLKLHRICYAPTLSNALTVKAITWLTTTNVLSGEITSIESGIPRKLKRPRKLGPIQFT